MLIRKLEFGTKYIIVDSRLKYDSTYLARLESSQGRYHCFARITDEEHKQQLFHDGQPTGKYASFPARVMIDSIREGDFSINGLKIIVKPRAKVVLVGFEHQSVGESKKARDSNGEMCLRLMKLLKGK